MQRNHASDGHHVDPSTAFRLNSCAQAEHLEEPAHCLEVRGETNGAYDDLDRFQRTALLLTHLLLAHALSSPCLARYWASARSTSADKLVPSSMAQCLVRLINSGGR